MKERVVADPQKSVRQVFTEVRASAVAHLQAFYEDEEIGAALPSFDAVSSILHRSRATVRPPLPATMEDIRLDGLYTRTTDGRSFLAIDDGTDERILGFTTNELMEALCDAPTVFMDGTFWVVPGIFAQLYTLHVFYRGQMIPFVYLLLPNKQKSTYSRMLSLVRNLATSLNLIFRPRTFQLDFEVSALKAIEDVFPAAELKGCNFHFGQCFWRKAQDLGLAVHYRERGIKQTVRSMGALAFVPLHSIDDAWLEGNADAPALDHPAYAPLEKLKEYFVNTWLENASIYPRSLWNHYRNFTVRTTNHLEGWHNALNQTIGKAHVNIFEMVRHLQAQEERYRHDMLQLRSGQAPPRSRAAYDEKNAKLERLVNQLETNEISLKDYILLVASNTPL